MNQTGISSTGTRNFFAFFVIGVLLVITVLVLFYTKSRMSQFRGNIQAEARIKGYSIEIANKPELEKFLEERGFFEGEVLLGTDSAKTRVDQLLVILTPLEQDQQITYWEYSDGKKIALANSWQNFNGQLILRVYIIDNDDGLKSSSNNRFLNAQILRAIFQLTRRLDLAEDANSLIVNYVDQMQNEDSFWFEIKQT